MLLSQSIRSEYIQSLDQHFASRDVSVVFLITIAAYLILNAADHLSEDPTVAVFRFPGNRYRAFIAHGDSLVYETCEGIAEKNATQGVPRSALQKRYQLSESTSSFRAFDLQTDGLVPVSVGWSRRLARAIRLTSEPRAVFLAAPHRSLGIAIRGITNGLRLTAIVLLLVAVLALAVAALSFATLKAEPGLVQQYQELYARKLTIEHALEHSRVTSRSGAGLRHALSPAAVVTAFCQQRYPDLYLTSIAVSYSAGDSALVVVAGRARSERTVFLFHSTCQQHVQPHALALHSLGPELVHSGGRTDTLTRFTLGFSAHE